MDGWRDYYLYELRWNLQHPHGNIILEIVMTKYFPWTKFDSAILGLLLKHIEIMTKELYRVRYRIEGPASATNASATVQLYSASESEAIYELKRRGTIGNDKTVIILSIERCWFWSPSIWSAMACSRLLRLCPKERSPLLCNNKGGTLQTKKWIFLTKLNGKNLVVSNGLHTFALRFSDGMNKLTYNQS